MRPYLLYLVLTLFAVSAVNAQLYNNRSRYLKTPYENASYINKRGSNAKKNQYRRATPRNNSYKNYRSRVNTYSKPYLTKDDYYELYRKPSVHNRYRLADKKKGYGRGETYSRINNGGGSLDRSFPFSCHCNLFSDLFIFDKWYAQMQQQRIEIKKKYEALFEEKIEGLLDEKFSNFKAGQKEFFKDYNKKLFSDFYRPKIANFRSTDLYKQQLNLGKTASYYKVHDYLINDNNGARSYRRGREPVSPLGDLEIDGKRVLNMNSRKDFSNRRKSAILNNHHRNSYKEYLISKEINARLIRDDALFYEYVAEKHVKHYDKHSDYEYKFGSFNAYIEFYQNPHGYGVRTHKYRSAMLGRVPFNESELKTYLKERVKKNIDYTYKYKLPTIERAIASVAVHELDEHTGRERIALKRANRGRLPKIDENHIYSRVKSAVLNDKNLKNAMLRYFEKDLPISERNIVAVKEAVGSRVENNPFEWSALEHMPYFKFQNSTNPDVIFALDLKVRNVTRANNPSDNSRYTGGRYPSRGYRKPVDPVYSKLYGPRNPRGGGDNSRYSGRRPPNTGNTNPSSRTQEYFAYKGIGDVLKNMYNNAKYYTIEGATMRYFLKQKGVTIPNSLSNNDLGKLFDFGGGNTHSLTIQFSAYARKYILNFHHYDGKYEWSLFSDLVKLKKLYDILKEKPVDFSNIKEPCIGDPIPNPEIAPQTNSGIQGGMHDTCARKNRKTICKGIKGRKWHNGVDIKNPYGAPVYAIYDGVATKYTQYKDRKIAGAGYYSVIESKVNGKNVRMVYFHLQEKNRTTGTVKAGDIIGYQGDSGNLKNGIQQGQAISHLHIKTQVNGVDDNPLNHIKTKIDPNTGKVISRCN